MHGHSRDDVFGDVKLASGLHHSDMQVEPVGPVEPVVEGTARVIGAVEDGGEIDGEDGMATRRKSRKSTTIWISALKVSCSVSATQPAYLATRSCREAAFPCR